MERRDLIPDGDGTGPCPACGAIAPAGAVACPACGEPVAATGDDAPLPPLPDGGLAALMPAWLRDAPASADDGAGDSTLSGRLPAGAAQELAPSVPSGVEGPPPGTGAPSRPAGLGADAVVIAAGAHAAGATQAGSPAGTAAFDPASVISADDLPAWLRALGDVNPRLPSPSTAPPEETLPEAASLPDADVPAAPVFLPRVEVRPGAPVAGSGGPTGSNAMLEAVAAAAATGIAAEPERVGGAGLVLDPPAVEPSVAVAPTPGDDGAPVGVAPVRGEPSTIAGIRPMDTDAAIGVAEPAPAPSPAAGGAIAPDPLHHDGARGPLPEGVAAGIATLAIMIVVAAILFLVWRALAAQ